MRIAMFVSVLVLLASTAGAQPAQSAPTTDPTKATYMSAADVAAALAKPGTVRVFNLAPYNVNIEHRLQGPQAASIHDLDAELFYVLDGGATMVTGGTLVNPTRPNPTNSSGTAIEGGVAHVLAKGDFILVPEGVPHWFSEIKGSLTQIALHLPRKATEK